MKGPVILLMEDDDFQYEVYEEALQDYQLLRARTGSQAIELIKKQTPAVIILDHILDNGEMGLDFLPELKELLPHVPIIVVSGVLETTQKLQALQGPRRAHYCISKPVDINELKTTIQTAITECGEEEIIRQFESIERSKRIDADALISRSADRLSRQTKILNIVKSSKGRPNISALARQFKVARKTIARDLQELIRRGQLPPQVFPPWEESQPNASCNDNED
jgi:DNA-binding NtrC family response regulator